MPIPPLWTARQRVALAAAAIALLVWITWLHPVDAHAALARAAGKEATAQGGSGGDAGGGFSELFTFLNTLANYLIYLGGALGTLGFIRAGVEYYTGSPNAGRTAVGTVVGLVLVLLAKGITL
jgi:hypothetical protein